MINGRTKGLSYERDIANLLKEIFPNCKRHLESQMQEARGFDLDNTGKLKFQLKRGRNYAPINKIEEIKEDGIKILITRADRKKDIVALYLTDFINLLLLLKEKGVVL